MPVPFSGGCACGAIRYECSAEPVVSYLCHCRDCQRASGSACLALMWVAVSAFTLRQGTPRYHAVTANSGYEIRRGFCDACGSPVLVQLELSPEHVALVASSLDDPSGFRPEMDIWVSTAQPWDYRHPDIPKFERQLVEKRLTQKELAELLALRS